MNEPTPQDAEARKLVDRGLISFEQAERIEGVAGPRDPARILEAALYLGAAAFVIAAFVWFADLQAAPFWGEPNPWGAFVVALAGAAVLFGIAIVLDPDRGAIGRAAGALVAGAVLLAALAISTAFDAWGLDGRWWQLLLSVVIAGVAYGGWWMRRTVLTEVALYLGVSSVMLAIIEVIEEASVPTDPFGAVSLSPETITGTAAGVLLWLLGAAWIVIGERGLLRSRTTAFVLGGLTAAFAAVGLSGSVNRWWIVLLALTAAGLIAAGISVRSSVLLVIGAGAALLAVPIGMSGWLRDPPVARTWVMIFGIPGLLLLAGAVVGADRHRRRPAAPAPVEEPGDPA